MKWPFRGREKTTPRLGLTLGGGAVRGAAHLGVLSVLEHEGIAPQVISGTSVGAIIGAGVAAGLTSAEMYDYFKNARWRDLARPSWHSKLSMLVGDPMGELLERIVQAHEFADLQIPFAAVASDILTATTYVFTEGPLREALVASSAIPGVFEPVRRDGRLLVDGGLTDNLPVDAARVLGATRVLAVDIMPQPDGTYEPQDMRDMLMMSLNIVEAAGKTSEKADLVIQPDVVGISFSDFSQAQQAYEAGIAAAQDALSDVRALV